MKWAACCCSWIIYHFCHQNMIGWAFDGKVVWVFMAFCFPNFVEWCILLHVFDNLAFFLLNLFCCCCSCCYHVQVALWDAFWKPMEHIPPRIVFVFVVQPSPCGCWCTHKALLVGRKGRLQTQEIKPFISSKFLLSTKSYIISCQELWMSRLYSTLL